MERPKGEPHPYSDTISAIDRIGRQLMWAQIRRSKELMGANDFEDFLSQSLDERDEVLIDLAQNILVNGPEKHKFVASAVCAATDGEGVLREGLASAFMHVTGITSHFNEGVSSWHLSPGYFDDGDEIIDALRQETPTDLVKPLTSTN